MKAKKILFGLLSALCLVLSTVSLSSCDLIDKASAFLGGYTEGLVFILSYDEQSYIVSDYDGADNDVVIPSKYKFKPVTSIGYSAFYDCISLTSITIPDSVNSIGFHAFEGCSSLTSIKIPSSVTSIGWGAFRGCASLTSITIPDRVKSIGDDAFRGCESLESVAIPDSVTSIGYRAFYSCSSLTSITIPDSVKIIVDYTFYECSSLETVYYTETEEQWNDIYIYPYGNDYLTNATIIYNYKD